MQDRSGTLRGGRTQVVVVVAQQEAAVRRRVKALHQVPRRIVLAAGLLHIPRCSSSACDMC